MENPGEMEDNQEEALIDEGEEQEEEQNES